MTAINVILQTGAAHVLTDGLACTQNGPQRSVITIGDESFQLDQDVRPRWLRMSKVSILAHCHAVVAVRGGAGILPLVASLLETHFTDFVSIRHGIVDILRTQVPLLDKLAFAPVGPVWDIVVVGWSESGPDAFHLVNHDNYPEVPPWEVSPIRSMSVLPADNEALAGLRLYERPSTNDIDPVIDGLAIMELQRDIRFGEGDRKFTGVGGFAQLTTVTSESISTRILRRWPLPT